MRAGREKLAAEAQEPYDDWSADRPLSLSTDVIAITKCPIWPLPVNRFTALPGVGSHCGRTSEWMVARD